MFSIEAIDSRTRRWIAGIFEHYLAAKAFLQSVPEATRATHNIVDVQLWSYPIFVVEAGGFEYGAIEFVRAKLKSLVHHNDEDHVHLNVYAILEDFVPAKPGSDTMGSLPHWHITDRTLESPGPDVFVEHLVKIARDACPRSDLPAESSF